MRRRELLAGAAAVAALGGAAAYAVRGPSTERISPVELRGLEAPGSEPGVVTVPDPDEVCFVEFFATWCSTCAAMMPEIVEAHERTDARFLAVTFEPLGTVVTDDDVADWWRRHDGAWQVAHDEDYELTRELGVAGVPTSYVLTPDGRVTWSGTGYHTADDVVTAVESAGV